jgi:hypothetical protein
MAVLSDLLMMATPTRPRRDLVWGVYRGPEEPDQESADFWNRDRDMGRAGRPPFFCAPTVRTAKAKSAKVMCRY